MNLKYCKYSVTYSYCLIINCYTHIRCSSDNKAVSLGILLNFIIVMFIISVNLFINYLFYKKLKQTYNLTLENGTTSNKT